MDNSNARAPENAVRFKRLGSVAAEQLCESRRWTTIAGDVLEGNAGDWLVTSDDDSQWTIRDAEFQRSYERGPGGTWIRVGSVLAWPATDGEVVDTLEGRATARGGDWIVQGPGGERWPVPADRFERTYQRAK